MIDRFVILGGNTNFLKIIPMNNHTLNIIRRIVGGEHFAFREFYEIYYLRVYEFCHYFLPYKNDCEIVVSNVFVIMWEKRALLVNINALEAYLYKVCRNEAFRYMKEMKNQNIISLDDMPVELVVNEMPSSVYDEMVEEEMMKILKQAVKMLPNRCKLIFLMIREQKMSHKQVAEVLSIKEGTVESQMNIAIKKICQVVNKYYPALINDKKPRFSCR